jgi:hypothetical protein
MTQLTNKQLQDNFGNASSENKKKIISAFKDKGLLENKYTDNMTFKKKLVSDTMKKDLGINISSNEFLRKVKKHWFGDLKKQKIVSEAILGKENKQPGAVSGWLAEIQRKNQIKQKIKAEWKSANIINERQGSAESILKKKREDKEAMLERIKGKKENADAQSIGARTLAEESEKSVFALGGSRSKKISSSAKQTNITGLTGNAAAGGLTKPIGSMTFGSTRNNPSSGGLANGLLPGSFRR